MKHTPKILLVLIAAFAFAVPAQAASVSEADYLNALDKAIKGLDTDIKKPDFITNFQMNGDMTPKNATHFDLSQNLSDMKLVRGMLLSKRAEFTKPNHKPLSHFLKRMTYTNNHFKSLCSSNSSIAFNLPYLQTPSRIAVDELCSLFN